MMDLVKEREQNKKKVICIYLILAMVVIELLTAGFFLDHFETSAIVKIIALTSAFAIAILGIIASVILEFNSGYWQCKECGNSFIPTFGEYFKSPHIGFTRKLKCPECGHKGYCKHKLTK